MQAYSIIHYTVRKSLYRQLKCPTLFPSDNWAKIIDTTNGPKKIIPHASPMASLFPYFIF